MPTTTDAATTPLGEPRRRADRTTLPGVSLGRSDRPSAAAAWLDARYLPALDGLRAVSILLVVVAHLGFDGVVPGGFGVTLFFFISGLLITRQLAGSLERTGRIGFSGFYLRRCLRLLPAALAFTLLAGGGFVAMGGRISLGGWAAALFWGANWYELAQHYRSDVPGVLHPFNILWSLAIEDHFYLIWPGLLALLWRPSTGPLQRRALLVLAALCVVAPLWRWWLFAHCASGLRPFVCLPLDGNPAHRFARLYRGTDTRADSIAWGALLALAALAAPGLVRRVSGSRVMLGAALAALALSFAWPGALFREALRYTLQGGCLLVLIASLLARPGLASRVLSSRPAVFIGRISYSLYLWHWAALMVAERLLPERGPRWMLLAVALSTVLSLGSFYGIERPMLRWRRRAGSHAPAEYGGAGASGGRAVVA